MRKRKPIEIKLKDEKLIVDDDIDLITNNLEFLGFAKVTDKISNTKVVFTTNNLISMKELIFIKMVMILLVGFLIQVLQNHLI